MVKDKIFILSHIYRAIASGFYSSMSAAIPAVWDVVLSCLPCLVMAFLILENARICLSFSSCCGGVANAGTSVSLVILEKDGVWIFVSLVLGQVSIHDKYVMYSWLNVVSVEASYGSFHFPGLSPTLLYAHLDPPAYFPSKCP